MLRLLLLCLLPSLGLAQVVTTFGGNAATFGGAVATWASTTPAAPSNVQIVLQAQNEPVATQNGSCTVQNKGGTTQFLPNQNEIGWFDNTGGTATQFNIYRATNGGSYPSLGSPTYTVSAATAASNFTAYAAQYPTQTALYGTYLAGGNGAQGPAPGITHVYIDTAATKVIGNGGASGADFKATANLTASSTSVNITAIASGTVAVGQGIGDTAGNIPIGTYLASGPGGTGTYTMSQAATGSATGETVGAVYTGNQGYTYKVTAVSGGVESALSTDAIIPFFANGHYVMANGAFNSCIATNQTGLPTSPLGYTQAVGWWPVDPGSGPAHTGCTPNWPAYINAFTGYSAANYNLSTTGYKYLNIAFYTTTPGFGAPTADPEICGDGPLTNVSSSTMALYGPSSWSTSAWNQYKVPFSVVFSDIASGVAQTAMYKITWGSNPGTGLTPGTVIYVEYWWSVN